MLGKRLKVAFEQEKEILTLEKATDLGPSKEALRKSYRREDIVRSDRESVHGL